MSSLADPTTTDDLVVDTEGATAATGLPVVTLGGDDAAGIGDVIAEEGSVTGFTLVKRSLFGGPMAATLPLDAVLAIGADAVVVRDAGVFEPTDAAGEDATPPAALRTGDGDREPRAADSPATLAEVRGTAVVAADTGDQVGRVDRVVVDPATASVGSIRLDNTVSDVRFLSWHQVTAFGEDVVEIGSAAVLRLPDGPREEGCRSTFRVRGKCVLTDTGDALGEIEDVEFDRADGRITGLLLEDGTRVDGGRLRGVGPHAVVVRS